MVARAKALPLPFSDPVAVAEARLAGDPPLTYEQRRARRPRAVRAKTINVTRLTKLELALGRALYPDRGEHDARPRARTECASGERPCPFVSCEHHLYLDVKPRTGAIKVNFPDVEADHLEELPETCALDVAERGGASLEEVGRHMNLTRERVRQIEARALAKLLALQDMSELRDHVDAGPLGKRRLPVVAMLRDEEEDERHDPGEELEEGEEGELEAEEPELAPGEFDVDAFALLDDESA